MADEPQVEYAGFWLRAWAAAVDALLFTLCSVSLLYAIHGRPYFKLSVHERGPVDFLNSFVLINLLVPLFWLVCGATPGKMAVAAKIVDARTGGKPGPRRLLIRFLGYYLAFLTFGLSVLWIAFDRRKRGLHDLLAGTAVVRTRR